MQLISQLTNFYEACMEQNIETKIIEAARTIFYEKGYSGATMRNIATKADVNLALLHYYYRTKDKIFEIVLSDAFSLLFKKLNKALYANVDIFEKIKLIVKGYTQVALTNPKLPGFVMHELEVNQKFIQTLILKYKQENRLNDGFEQFSKELDVAIKSKQIKPIDPTDLFVDILSLSLFPFIAKNCLSGIMFPEKQNYNHLLKNRAEYVTNFLIESIKV